MKRTFNIGCNATAVRYTVYRPGSITNNSLLWIISVHRMQYKKTINAKPLFNWHVPEPRQGDIYMTHFMAHCTHQSQNNGQDNWATLIMYSSTTHFYH